MRTATLQRVVCRVSEDKDIVAVSHWSDGTRTMRWLGFFSAIGFIWSAMRAGVPVDMEDQ